MWTDGTDSRQKFVPLERVALLGSIVRLVYLRNQSVALQSPPVALDHAAENRLSLLRIQPLLSSLPREAQARVAERVESLESLTELAHRIHGHMDLT